jgi:hypothetical protein
MLAAIQFMSLGLPQRAPLFASTVSHSLRMSLLEWPELSAPLSLA